jgi:CheY-like chemotaxis protein
MQSAQPEHGQPSVANALLCVDDDPGILQMRKMVLESNGYSVRTAASGPEALTVLQSTGASLVILDYLMPGMNGDELARSLRDLYPDLPLVAVSAVGALPKSLLDKVDAHLQKGDDPEVLLSTVANVLQRRSGTDLSQPRTVLCVEDEDLQLRLRALLFKTAGYEVIEAASATAALEKFRSGRVDAVVMDYSLSGSDGASTAAEMKKIQPGVPIVILSGFAPPASAQGFIDCWLRKVDVEPEDLLSRVRELIAHSDRSHSAFHPE